MKKLLALTLALASLAAPAAASAKIIPLDRAYPSGKTEQASLCCGGMTSNIAPNHKWFRVTVAYDTQLGEILVGCRGQGTARVRVWTFKHGHGWDQMTCRDTQPWHVALKNVTPELGIQVYVRFTPCPCRPR